MTTTAAPVRRSRAGSRADLAGFTLIEVLAALAISSVVIVATAAFLHDVALNFDRGTQVVGNAEHMLLAVDRLSADFGSARPVPQAGEATKVAFVGAPTMVKFVAAGGVAAGPQGEELVSLTVEQTDRASRLIRRRAAWRGPLTRFDGVPLGDKVDLIEGRVDIAFAFGRVAPNGAVTWSETWTAQPRLPGLVRLTVRDRASGAELIPGAQFVLRADAPADCAGNAACQSGGKPNEPAKDEQAQDAPTKDAPTGERR
ncbi:hypothetical protein AS156_37025 [Bradyrhizobium macuxiense]|uniref:General secretion pathway protein J n=1 Tax=Bradyrhizobium macuxiense TaxID=1755647 RepID=A0A120FQ11_9BRAD|nr:prepilin-type N-terminal cleavage/methylation domain-containing protein [Bradyrhizobium macuxiense]KWV57815.1 hypothetical protein AS156_37025 [Bradyrhizobium macuxiense]